MNSTMTELRMEELELVNGGGIFSTLTNAMKNFAEFAFDTATDFIVETCKEYVINPVSDVINHPSDFINNITLTTYKNIADALTGK